VNFKTGIMIWLKVLDEVNPAPQAPATDIQKLVVVPKAHFPAELELPAAKLVPHAANDVPVFALTHAHLKRFGLFIDIRHA